MYKCITHLINLFILTFVLLLFYFILLLFFFVCVCVW